MRTRTLRHAAAALGILAATIVFTACTGGQRSDSGTATRTDARTQDAEEPAVTHVLEALTGSVERENTFEFMEHVSDRYSPSSLVLKSAVDAMLVDHLGYTFTLRTVQFHREEDEAILIVEWRYGRSHRQTGAITWENGQAELAFRREQGRWKLLAQNGDPLFTAPR